MSGYVSRRVLLASLAGASGHVIADAIRPGPARAAVLPKPEGKVVLTMSGLIKETNGDGVAEFDIAMFEGVRMAALLDRIGATGTTLTARALNDYSTDIPVEDFRKYEVLLALKRDGAYMPVKDKGPLFIVYPYDSDPELKHQRFYSRSAWQVARMVLK